jgi:hypothetical protein
VTDLDLLRTVDSAKDDLCEPSTLERSIANPTNDLPTSLDNSHGDVILVEYQTGNILARHLGKLTLEQVLETDEQDGGDRSGIA